MLKLRDLEQLEATISSPSRSDGWRSVTIKLPQTMRLYEGFISEETNIETEFTILNFLFVYRWDRKEVGKRLDVEEVSPMRQNWEVEKRYLGGLEEIAVFGNVNERWIYLGRVVIDEAIDDDPETVIDYEYPHDNNPHSIEQERVIGLGFDPKKKRYVLQIETTDATDYARVTTNGRNGYGGYFNPR